MAEKKTRQQILRRMRELALERANALKVDEPKMIDASKPQLKRVK